MLTGQEAEESEDFVADNSTPTIVFSEPDLAVLDALRDIREATGTIFSRDLYVMLGLDQGAPTEAKDVEVRRRLNSWFTSPLVLVEGTGSRHIPGMLELVTDTRYRVLIDLLTGFAEQKHPRLHPVSVSTDAVAKDRARLSFAHADLVLPGEPVDDERRKWMPILHHRYSSITDAVVEVPALSGAAHWADLVKRKPNENAVELNLSGMYVENFSASTVLDLVPDFEGTPLVRLWANGTVFAGEIADFRDVAFDIVDLEWAVFSATTVTFENSLFACKSEEDETIKEQIINLRDTTFCDSVDRLIFDDVRIIGDTHEVSLEDAVIRGGRCTFTRSDLGRAALNCYQTQFLVGATIEFIDTKMSLSRLHFVDAFFESDPDAPAAAAPESLVIYRVDPLAPADFAVRAIPEMRIENSSILAPIRFANIRRISFWGSSVAGGLMTIDPKASRGAPGGSRNSDKFWFLDAIQNGRSDRHADLSAEFAVIKEVFHGMGEYDLEDEAFVRHMRFKRSSPLGRATYRVLDVVGRFGTSPGRTLVWLLATWLVWFLINAALMLAYPAGFHGSVGNFLLNSIVYTNASLTQGAAAVVPTSFAMHLVWVLQSLFGWFFLGYFFSSFVRKTIR
jgi:hypothetical protein